MRINGRIPLHLTLLTLILSMLLSVAGTMAWYNYKKSSDAAIRIATDLLDQANDALLIKIDSMFQPVLALGNRVSELPNLADKPSLTSHPTTWFFLQTLETAPHIYSIYMGYDDGDFYQIIQVQPGDEERRLQLGAPTNTRFVLRRIIDRGNDAKADVWRFLDSSRRTLGSRVDKVSTFDPRTRPWFQTASTTEGLVRTPPYVFASNRSLGLTVARGFDGPTPGVFGVDLTLKTISSFLAEQQVGEHGQAILFDFNGNLVAHPNPDYSIRIEHMAGEAHIVPTRLYDLDDPVIDALYSRFISEQGAMGSFGFKVGGKEYLARITRISDTVMSDGYVAVFAPQADFTATMRKVLNDSELFTLILLAIAMPLAFLFARAMAAPLKRIAAQTDEIRQFQLENTEDVSSFITEIHQLAASFTTMKGALTTFGQYVPKSLVRQIIRSETPPSLGGERRPLSILFTDIADFTTISETMQPEALMLQASEYFQEIGSCLLEGGGTIDKFIGDAIMAFWNAPKDVPDHILQCCAATLDAANASNALNARWEQEGKAIFFTRLGIHTGDCIVGNVGSSDRMNYTAMGDAVNMASRLEGLNKYFGTQILASRDIYDGARDSFLFCPVGRVVPKGAIAAMEIYTLLGSRPGLGLAHEADPTSVAFCSQWEQAYNLFMAHRFQEAAEAFETLAAQFTFTDLPANYLDRARAYAATPPGDGWQGVETFTTK